MPVIDPRPSSPSAHPLRVVSGVIAASLCMALVEASRSVIGAQAAGQRVPFTNALGYALQFWGVMGVLIPIPLLAMRLQSFEPGRRARAWFVHILGALGFATLHVIGLTALWVATGTGSAQSIVPLLGKLSSSLITCLMIYAAVVGGVQALRWQALAREQELAASRLEASLTQARLAVLQSQLNPHFLFNTLNAINALALTGKQEAVSHTLGTLSDLLRISLDDDRPQQIPLSDELDFLDRYLDIQRTRFGERLTVTQSIDPDTTALLVPSMILQPLVENAIVHGISALPGPGSIHVGAAREGGTLCIEVHDSGPGARAPATASVSGIGLSNTRARLAQLYGDQATLTLREGPAGGMIASLRLPASRDPHT
jgi:signal transduction histidine kinase